jgi:hypothetical protein
MKLITGRSPWIFVQLEHAGSSESALGSPEDSASRDSRTTDPPPASTASFAVARPVRGDKYIKSSNAIRKTSITIILPMQHVAKIEVVVF